MAEAAAAANNEIRFGDMSIICLTLNYYNTGRPATSGWFVVRERRSSAQVWWHVATRGSRQ